MKSNIDEASVVISDATVKFGLKSGMFYEIYDDSVNPFSGSGATVEVSSNHGYKFFNSIVKFPIKPFNPDYAVVVAGLTQGSELVVILEQEEKGTDDTSRYVVFGLQGGLYCTTPMFEMANDSVWEIELVENRTDELALFLYDTDLAGTTELASMLLQYEWIQLYIGDGTSTPLEASIKTLYTTKTSYIKYPDNTTVSSTAGIVNKEWDGEAGSVIIIIPKDTGTLYLSDGTNASKFIGAFDIKESVNTLMIQYCPYITSVSTQKSTDVIIDNSVSVETLIAPLATNILAASSGLTDAGVKLILDNAYSLYLDGVEDGIIDLTGTTAIDGSNVSTVHAPADYNSMISAMELAGWTITIVTI